jgi:thiamine pyrophosphate-dependent acetolactate synthase large subunit-like protein
MNDDVPVNLGNRAPAWGSDVVADALRALDLEYIALVPGASYRGFHDSIVNYLGNSAPRMVVCLHEEHAVAIADGYAKALDRPMAAALHSNVGLMHGSIAIFNAWCGRSPVIVFGASGPMDAHARRPWIEWIHTSKDQGALVRSYVKWDDQPASPESAVESVLRANQIARTRPYGPVYVCLDVGLQEAELTRPVKIPPVERFRPAAPPAPAPEALDAALKALKGARFPLILAGRVSRDPADWQRRITFAEALGAGVMSSMHGPTGFPSTHPLHILPMCGERPNKTDAELVRQADVILSLDWLDLSGFLRQCFGESQTQAPAPATIIQCTLDSYLANGFNMAYQALSAVDINILADPDSFVAAALDRLGDAPKATPRLPKGLRHWCESVPAKPSEGPLTMADIAHAYRAMSEQGSVTLARAPLGWPGFGCRFEHPLDYLGKDAGGAVGTGPAHCVGVALALKDSGRPVVGIIGDGDYLMGVTALWTASRMRLPLMMVICNNRSYFNDEMHQERVAIHRDRPKENRWIGQRLDDPPADLAGMARAQGFEADGPVETRDALAAAFARGAKIIAEGGRYLVDVRIKSD